MRITITGAGGLVASALARRFAAHDPVLLRHRDLDITDESRVREAMESIAPDLIANCAVIGVDTCEADPVLANAVNVGGVANLARAAEENGAEFLHFSSNYVFDGEGETLYAAGDVPNPVNVYGRTKWEGEQAASRLCPRTYVIRTSWVFGRGKDNFFSAAARRLKNGERVRAASDVWASCTFADDLAARIGEMIDARQHGTWHVVNDGVCSYETFAREAARLAGADPSLVEAIRESDAKRAPRPRYTPMRCDPPMRRWEEALAEFVGV